MTAKSVTVAVAVGITLGVIATPAPDAPEPKVQFKFIKGPSHTKTVTKEVPGPAVVMEWPASCKNALTFMEQGTKQANSLYNHTKVYFDYIDSVQRSQLDNPISVSQVAVWLYDHKSRVRNDMQDMSYTTSDLEIALNACMKAIDKAEQDAQHAASRD